MVAWYWTTQPHPAPRLKKDTCIHLLPFMACSRVNFTFHGNETTITLNSERRSIEGHPSDLYASRSRTEWPLGRGMFNYGATGRGKIPNWIAANLRRTILSSRFDTNDFLLKCFHRNCWLAFAVNWFKNGMYIGFAHRTGNSENWRS